MYVNDGRLRCHCTGTGQKKFKRRLVAPTVCLEKPFGQQAEGLSHFGDETYAIERAVQTEDFEDSTFFDVVSGKPVLPKALRKFKRLHRNVDDFVPAPVEACLPVFRPPSWRAFPGGKLFNEVFARDRV